MSSFLFTVWEGGGNVPPVLAVTRKLASAGHHIRIMSDECNRPEAEATGAEFVSWTRAPSRPDKSPKTDIIRDWEPENPVDGLARVFERIMFGPAEAYAADTMSEIARARPDAIVSSEMLFGVMAAAEANDVPFTLFCPNVSLFPMEGVPPLGPGLMPATSAADRQLHAEITAGNSALFNQGLPGLNAARRALGLAPLAHVFEQTARARMILLGTARAFDFAPETLPAHIHYVGPQFHNPPADESWRSPWPAADTRPLAVLSFSTTFQNQAETLQRVIDAAGALPLRLLVTLGPALDPAPFTVPDNVKLVARAPHGAVMDAAQLVITHGGHGTVMRALEHDCPLLIFPMGRDQNDNAARVTARGAGLALDPARATVEEIRAAITRLLGEDSFAHAAGRLGAAIRQEAQSSSLLALLDTLRQTHPKAGAPEKAA